MRTELPLLDEFSSVSPDCRDTAFEYAVTAFLLIFHDHRYFCFDAK
jgi:hypothetical protein